MSETIYLATATKIDIDKYILNSFSSDNQIIMEAIPMENSNYAFTAEIPEKFKTSDKLLNLVNKSSPFVFSYNKEKAEAFTKYLIFSDSYYVYKVNTSGSQITIDDTTNKWIPKLIVDGKLKAVEYKNIIYYGDIEATQEIIELYNKLKEEEEDMPVNPGDNPVEPKENEVERYSEPTGLDSLKSTVEYNQENFGYIKDDDGIIEHFSYTNSENAEVFTWLKRGSVGTNPKEAQITPKNNEPVTPESPTIDPVPPEIEPTDPEIEQTDNVM